ncbi:nucleoside-diphosphate sugar epimerase [Candidatus Woesebacteria bacterium RIFCSPHIGHO2_01_FULL_38_9]|uniref:Nucleoside-diphosphate sugar epimerase n=2 Tax=Candidatus Woeseibacteriota TaxID=1752722 RepID=A0A1F7Y3J4_9BACT|nr:MAG: nucleoside-diphosphate sugar epimerase [Candidatus Woesebacteria bacterium RIFCSPHIGHO2_01_FULL_38_9]OGM60569.1 MAG: nucleoside-diphosphate sugar epimerase [Candidatus Woesebacteria bacterium RIFCSPLOWO2_01_FULL_39_10]
MKVLVTGGAGFAGSHTCEYYKKQGAKVIAYDNLTKFELRRTGYSTEKARFYNVDFLKKIGVNIAKEDIRDRKTLESYAKSSDYIIHTAAQPAMTISWEDPELDFSTNVVGTFNLLEIVRKYKIPMVSCATIHIYGNKINQEVREGKTRYIRRPEEIDEGHRLVEGVLTPLHASKRTGDLYVQTYIDTYKLPLASFRLTGLYGSRQFGGEDHGWVANFAIRAVMGYPLVIFGTGKQARDILYVSDLVKAFDAFFKKQKPGVYNIGGGRPTLISLIDCIQLIEDILDKKVEVKYQVSRMGDLIYFACDTRKAERYLGWQARVLPRVGVTELVEWVKKNKKLFKIS